MRLLLILSIFASGFTTTLDAQGTATAKLSGTLTDESGGALPRGIVEATSLDTGLHRAVAADARGRYFIADLPIGSYKLRASSPHFDIAERSPVTLTVGADIVLDFSLKVGEAQETVSVSADVSQVETQSAAISSLVSAQQVHSLPLNGRNLEQLISLAPGVSVVPASLAQVTTTTSTNPMYGNQDNYSVSGSRPVNIAFLLDGTDVADFFNHAIGSNITGSSLGVDAIAEFRVLTNTYSAQFGGTGAVVNIVSKSGTNQFHGSAYDFLRNNVLDSGGYFDVDQNGRPIGAAPYRRNQFGGNLGGPIHKNRLFFFANYEGLRSSLTQTEIAYVPEPYVLKGELCTVNPQAQSPGSTLCPSQNLSQVVSSVPSLQAGILGLYPTPGAGAPDLGGYAPYPERAAQVTNENYFLGRMDYSLSTNDSLFARYVVNTVNQNNPFSGSAIPLWPEAEATANQYISVEEQHVVDPTTINLLRASFVRTNSNGHTTRTTSVLQLFPAPGRQDTSITPGGGLSTIGANGANPFIVVQNKTSIGDDLFWSRGAHRFSAGFSVARVQSVLGDGNYQAGAFEFYELADFLRGATDLYLGAPPSTAGYTLTRGFRQIDFFPYIQDDWRLNPRLTLNVGLRWDFATNAIGSGTPLEAIVNPATATGYTITRHVLATNPNVRNFDPRIGLAYDPFRDHKTAIRAGFGIFHEQIEARTYATNYDLAAPSAFTLDSSVTLPFPGIPNVPPSQYLGLSYQRTTTAPYVMQYNLMLEREMFANTVVSVGYVGSRGVHLFSLVSDNLPIHCAAARAPLPAWCPAAPSGPPGSTGNPFTGELTNPNFQNLYDDVPVSTSRYNSLQVSMNRQMGQGVHLQASYTLSRCIDDGSASTSLEGSYGVMDSYNLALDRGPCAFNREQNFLVNSVYALPFHRNRLISAWQLSVIWTATSGLPVNLQDGYDASLSGNAPARPNYSGVRGCSPNEIVNKSIPGPAIQFFNPGCYALQPIGTEGNVGRDSLYGPDLMNVDVAISRRMKVGEKLNVDVRSEIFNIFNRSNFGQPNPDIFTTPTAGQITSLATPPRQIQFALRLSF